MKDFNALTDEEINALVIKHLILTGFYTDDPQEVSHRQYVSDGWCWGRGTETGLRNKDGSVFVTHQNGHRLDFCNDADVAWQLIAKHRISIEFDGDHSTEPQTTWCHTRNLDRTCGTDYQKNPLRAATITFLLMQELPNVPANSTGSDLR
ncbi:hypothetical protein [Enterobacter kobei]|uniref:hypothetical protein n=1 Tax=Enterobacter kobei TaxID=208224 RepID=UPI0039C07EAA